MTMGEKHPLAHVGISERFSQLQVCHRGVGAAVTRGVFTPLGEGLVVAAPAPFLFSSLARRSMGGGRVPLKLVSLES